MMEGNTCLAADKFFKNFKSCAIIGSLLAASSLTLFIDGPTGCKSEDLICRSENEMTISVPDNPEYDAEQKNMRRATRAPLIVEKVPCGDGQKTFFGYAKNISRGGLFIATLNPRELGEEFMLELTLPMKPKHKVSCRCKVVWKRLYKRKSVHEPGMGLRFLDLSAEDGNKIDEWVTELTVKNSR